MQFSWKYAVFLALASCAVQSQPQGGPKDETPPVVVKQEPVEGALEFNGHQAVIEFDEYIQAQKLRSSLSSSPELPELRFEVRGKKLALTWAKEPAMLEETTYRISLGNEVGDLNENNKINNLQFVWSTGSFIDSMQFNGIIAKKGEGAFDALTIWFLPAGQDSLVAPTFTAVPSKDGKFSLRYLPTDTFDVLVFEDLNFNKIWDEGLEPFGFRKGLATTVDSVSFEIPYSSLRFETPELDSLVQDSVVQYMDTTAVANLGQVRLIIPPSPVNSFVWAKHESGYQRSFVDSIHLDTLEMPYSNWLPGKYTIEGFVDENGNGSWDGPSWWEETSGEALVPAQSFDIKANWELDQPLLIYPSEPKDTTADEN